MTLLKFIDKIVHNDSHILRYKSFNDSFNKKFLFLRSHKESSWVTDTKNIWGPDVESEYIVDLLTNNGKITVDVEI